ncbi:hypothetical protein GCM10011575_12010 [Microlunatus endophyticus]|uniref:DUF3349 domain-containing protein n=1 Tax=Microlunatus endophyticus TaxID=1716077 RepID=A0A917W0X0_9ACTN|nr:DUF3349 domain-containing protein [Microlunatus endophyticus]GGL55218.1 hypothetical protein GCM10011575_12010 [Microlunatus endophyticus]
MSTETDPQLEPTADSTGAEKKQSIIGRVIGWLTAGYPEGIPAADRFPVIAVLKRRLTDEQVHEIVEELTHKDSPALADGVITHDEVEALIQRILSEQPTHDEIRRVSARLAAGGWPLAGGQNEESGAP